MAKDKAKDISGGQHGLNDGFTGGEKSEYVASLENYLQLLQKEIEHLRNKEISGTESENNGNKNSGSNAPGQSGFHNCSNINELTAVFEENAGAIISPIETKIFILGSDRKIVFPEISAETGTLSQISRKLEEEGLIDWATDRKELTLIPNIYEDEQENLTKILIYPLYLKSYPIGIIISKTARQTEISPEESEQINTIAGVTAFVLDNIRSADEIRKMNSRLSAMNAQVDRTANFATLGELTAAILKEIDIPVEIIRSNIGFIESGFGDTKRRIEIIREQLDQLAAKTSKLSDLFRFTGREQASRPVNIASVLDEALLFTDSQLTRDGIIVEKTIDEPGAEIIADKARLEQAILSIIIYVRDSLPDGGRLVFGIYSQGTRKVVFSASFNAMGSFDGIPGSIFEQPDYSSNPVIQQLQATIETLGGRTEIITDSGNGATIKLIFTVYKF